MPSLLKDSTVTLLARGLVLFFSILTSIVLSRVLGPSQKGSYSLLLLIISVASLMVMFGLGSANVYFGARNPDSELPKLTGNSLVAAFGLGFLGILCLELLTLLPPLQEYLIDNNVDVLWVRGLILFLPIVLSNAYLVEIIRARGAFVRYNLVALWKVFISLVGVATMVWCLGWGVNGAIIAWVLSLMAAFALIFVLALRAAGSRPLVDWRLLRRCFRFGVRLHPGNIAQFLNYRFDAFLVAWYLTPAEVGLYVTASSLSERIWEIPHSIRTVLLYRVAATKDPATAIETTARVSRVVVVLVGLLCLVIMLVSQSLIALLYGQAYLPAAPALFLLLPGTWALSIGKILAIHLAGTGRPEIGTVGAIVSLVSTVLLDIILIPQLGIVGAALASSFAYSLSTLVILVVFLRVTELGPRDVLLLRRADVLLLSRALSAAVRQRIWPIRV
jgi:O-antigen/teichoic acid export membrane protein